MSEDSVEYEFLIEDAMDEAYALDPADPKHPDFLEALVDWVDMTRKAEKENGPIAPPDPED